MQAERTELGKAEAMARETLTKMAEEKAALEKSVSDLQAKLAGLEGGMQEAGRRQSDLESTCAALQAERTELGRNLEASHQEIAALTRNVITLEDRLETFESRAREKEEAARAHLKEVHAALGRKEEEAEAQQRELQRLRDQLSQTQSELRQRAHEADETANGLRRAEACLSDLKTSNAALEDEVGQQKASVEHLLSDISLIREQGRLDQKQRFSEIASLTRRILEQEAWWEARESALQQEIASLTESEAQRVKLQTELNAFADKIIDRDRAAENLRRELEQASGHLIKVRAEIEKQRAKFHGDLKVSTDKIIDREQTIVALRNELAAQKQAANAEEDRMISDYASEINKLHRAYRSSTSWRFSAPIRVGGRLLRGNPPRG